MAAAFMAIVVGWGAHGATEASPAEPAPDGGSVDDASAAEALFHRGKELLDQGRIDEACATFEQAHRTQRLPGVLLNMARCHELQGRLATATTEYRAALAAARSAGREDRVAFIEERLAEIQPRLSWVTLRLGEPVRNLRGLTARRGGSEIGLAGLDVPFPVEPGRVRIEVGADRHESILQDVEVGPGETAIVWVHDLEERAPEPAASTVFTPRSAPTPPPGDPEWQRTLGWSGIVLGAISVATGVVFGGIALAEESAARDAGCVGATCPTRDALARSNAANDAGVAANVLLPAGLLVGAAGAVLVLTFDEGGATLDADAARPGGPAAGSRP